MFLLRSGADMESSRLWCQKRKDQAEHGRFSFAGRAHQRDDLMRISFQRGTLENGSAVMVGITQILQVQPDSFSSVLLFKFLHRRILTVIFLRHFHNVHQTSCGNRQGNSGWDEADQRVYRAGQCAGQREEHGHGSVTDRIAPHTVDAPSITAVGYDEADDGHQNSRHHGHFLKVELHMNVIILKAFQFGGIKMDQVKRFDRLDIGKRFLVESVQPGIHGCAALIVFCHSPQQRAGKKCTERYAKECEQGKGRIIIQHDRQCADKAERVNNQIRDPVQNTA